MCVPQTGWYTVCKWSGSRRPSHSLCGSSSKSWYTSHAPVRWSLKFPELLLLLCSSWLCGMLIHLAASLNLTQFLFYFSFSDSDCGCLFPLSTIKILALGKQDMERGADAMLAFLLQQDRKAFLHPVLCLVVAVPAQAEIWPWFHFSWPFPFWFISPHI